MSTFEWISLIGVLLGGFWILADKLAKMNLKIAQIEGKLWSTERIKDEITLAVKDHMLNCPYKKKENKNGM